MWRPLARTALLRRRTPLPELLPLINQPQVPNRETLSISPLFIESASRFSLLSGISIFHQNSRHFSSNTAENPGEQPSDPLTSETDEIGGSSFDFGSMNAFDGNTKSEVEAEDSIFNDALDGTEVSKGFGEDVDGSVALDENLDSVAAEDESIGQVKENDLEKVETLLSLLHCCATVNGSFESHFEGLDLVLDQGLVLKVLQTPDLAGESVIRFFRWLLKKPEFKFTTSVLDALVSAICVENRRREAYALWDLINEIAEKEKGVVSADSLNSLIEKFSKLGKAKAAFDVFNKFEEFGCLLGANTYYLTIEVLCKRSFYNWACSACEKMLNADKLPDAERVGKIISYLCKGGMTKDAHLVYLYAKDKKTHPPQSSVDFLISSLSRIVRTDKEQEIDKELDKQNVSLAIELLNDYPAESRKYATKTFSSVIKKLCWIEDVEGAKKLLLEMIHSGPLPGNEAFNCVINGLTKAGDVESALSLLKLMETRGLKPDLYTYSVIMSGYTRVGEMEEACEIFGEAKKKHSKLTPVMYHTLIRGFCMLEQFDEAVDMLREMRQHGVNPNHDEYNKLIKSLCFKALDWKTAEKLQEEMKVNGLILNSRTSALISAVKELDEGVSAPA